MTVVINGTTGIDTGTGSLIAADATTPTYLDLFEDTDNGSNYVRLIAPTSVASNRTITLPDGTGTVAVNNVSGVLVSGTAVASTSGTSIDFTSIPSWVKRITVMFNGVSTNGTSIPIVQLGDSGGVETSGYLGSVSYAIQGGTSGAATHNQGFYFIHTHAATFAYYGLLIITNLDSNTWAITGTLGNSTAFTTQLGGIKALSAALDRIRITTVNGTDTFDAGTINIIYE